MELVAGLIEGGLGRAMHLNKHENEHKDAVAAVGNVAKKGLRGRESPHTKSAGPEIPPGVPGWSTREPNPNIWPKPSVK